MRGSFVSFVPKIAFTAMVLGASVAQAFTLPSEVQYIPVSASQQTMTGVNISPAVLNYAGMKKGEIALTFDDGPNPNTTPRVLQILRDHGIKATFFLVGHNVERYPDLVKQILLEGHSVGNHTWTHKAIGKDMSIADARQEIIRTHQALTRIASEINKPIQPFFRFPEGFGAGQTEQQNMIRALGLGNFHWAMSAHDSRTTDPEVTLRTSIEMLDKYGRGIFLCHDTRPHTVEMLPRFLEELNRRGYKTIYFQAQMQ